MEAARLTSKQSEGRSAMQMVTEPVATVARKFTPRELADAMDVIKGAISLGYPSGEGGDVQEQPEPAAVEALTFARVSFRLSAALATSRSARP